jgi:hypothetical protein
LNLERSWSRKKQMMQRILEGVFLHLRDATFEEGKCHEKNNV